MRTVRILLASLAITALAACGTDSITAPAEVDQAVPVNNGATCAGVWVTVINSTGIAVQTCVDTRDGGQYGGGGG